MVDTFEKLRKRKTPSFEELRSTDGRMQSVLNGEVNMAELFPDTSMQYLLGISDDPKKMESRMISTIGLSHKLGIPPDNVDTLFDPLSLWNWGIKDMGYEQVRQKLAQDLSEKTKSEFINTFKPTSTFGYSFANSLLEKPAMAVKGGVPFTPGKALGLDVALQKTSDYMMYLRSEKGLKITDEAMQGPLWPIEQGQAWYKIEPDMLPQTINRWAAVVGDQLPLMLMAHLSRRASKAVGEPLALATAGAYAMITGGPEPTDIAAAPVVFRVASKVTEHVGGAMPLIGVETAAFMDRANEIGIDNDIAEKYARQYGLGSGTIEYAQWLWNLKAFSRLTGGATKGILKKVLLEIGGATWEGVEEISQLGLENKLIQKAIDEQKTRNPEYDQEKPETWVGWKEAGGIGFGVSLITRMPGHAYTATRKARMSKDIQKATGATAKEAVGVVTLMERGQHQVAKEILAEEEVRHTAELKAAEEAARVPKEAPQPRVAPITPPEAVKPPTKPVTPAEEVIEKPVKKAVPEVAIPELELTKQEEADIAKIEAEIEEPFVMERVKDVGFVIKETATGKEAAVVAKRKAAKAELAKFIEGEKKVRETRRKPKVLTDKTTISKLITEAKALKESIKKAAQAARKAFTVGKREGIEKVKTHYRDLRVREKARKELKQRLNKAIKTIKKPISKAVDFFYREAIENLQVGIDPSFRTKKTLQQRERTREFLARKPEALKDMPVKLLKKLAKKSIGEYTVAEVEQIATEIERLKKQGKLKRKLRQTQKARKLEATKDEIVGNITKGEPIKSVEEPVVYSTTKQGFIKTAWEKTKAWTWRPSRIFDMLDGVRDFAGTAHRFFVDRVNRATDTKLRMTDKRKEAGMTKMKELGITLSNLTQIRIINNIRYTVDEMIGIYNANKNRLAKLAIMYGNKINEATINDVIDNLTEQEKAWGDYIIQDYDENYERLRNTVIEVENRDMGYEENYTPMRRMEIDYTTHTEEIVDAILRKEALRKAYAEHGMTIKRKEVPAEFQKPIRLNATNVWLEQISKQEQYINLAGVVKDMHKVAGDKDFREVVEKQFGKEFNKVIRNYIDRVANPNIYKSYNSLENLSRRLRQNAVIAYLSYNLVTMAKQIPSVFLYLQDAGPTHLISSAMEFVANPIKMVKMVREKDPQVKHRAIERELEELKVRQPGVYNVMINKFGRAGMEGIYLFDAVARTIGWNAVYQKALHSGKSEVEAVRLAQNATLRTQPAAAAKDVAQLYATSEFANWFTMFTNQLNQIYNIATYDFSGYIKNADYQKAALSMTGLAVTALLIWIATHRRLPEDEEDFADAAAEQAINAVPLVGKALMAGKRGWGGTEIPAFELPKAGARAIKKVYEGKFNVKDMAAIAEAVAVTAGIPYIGPKRVVKAIKGGPKELIGGEPIGGKKPISRIKRR